VAGLAPAVRQYLKERYRREPQRDTTTPALPYPSGS
jgi:hypothetical protein